MAKAFDLFGSYTVTMEALKEIDEKLDSLDDAKGAGKRAHVNDLVKAQADNIKILSENLNGKLESSSPEEIVGFVTGLIRSLKTAYDKKINEYVEAWAKDNIPDETVAAATLSDDEIKALEAERAELYKVIKTLRELAQQLQIVEEENIDEELPMARKRTGSRGSRGPQVWSLYVYSVNGENVDDETSLTDVAKSNGYDKRKELTDFIASQMGDSWKPGKDFEVTLPNGKVLAGESFTTPEVPVNVTEEDEVTETDTVDENETVDAE